MPREERASLTADKLHEIRFDFSMLSERGSRLKAGEGFTESWQVTSRGQTRRV
jgi:hypothetical protein